MFITSNSYNCNDLRLGPFRQAVYILVYSIENRSRLKAFQLTIYWKRKLSLLSIYLSYFFFHAGNGQRRNSHLRHHSAVLSFIRHDLHIACHIFQIQVGAPKFNNYADTALCMKKMSVLASDAHSKSLKNAHKKEPNGCKNFKFNCTNLSFLPKYFRKLKIKLLKLKTKWIWNTLVCKLSYFCLISLFVLNLIRKNEKLFCKKKSKQNIKLSQIYF